MATWSFSRTSLLWLVSPLYRHSVWRGSIMLMYETFEHTADLGLRIRAPDFDTLFVEAARALFSAIVEDLATVESRQRVDVQLQSDDQEYLLFDWLNELLYRFDTQHLLFGRFEVEVQFLGETGFLLKGTASGEL